MKHLFLILVLLTTAGAGGVAAYRKLDRAEPTAKFRTAKIVRGDLLITVGATGTVEPEEVIDIGAQVIGRIKEIGLDPRGENDPTYANKSLDYGSPVKKGMLLAQIDASIYQAQRDQAAASLDRAKADLLQLEARRDQTEAEWKRAQRLQKITLSNFSPTGSSAAKKPVQIKGITDADFILAKANFEMSKANVEVGKTTIRQADSTLKLADTNLSYTTIVSPVDGTIIDRRVNIGQTVVSSLNAPSLFLLAKDLRRMEVWASVNEADIGLLKIGMPVHFTVDAFPEDIFRGKVTQIRLNAAMTQNVVTYTVVITTDNSNMRLLPYLTADVKFETDKRQNVLLVPNSALRFQPQPELVEGATLPGSTSSVNLEKGKPGSVWVQTGPLLRAIQVGVGLSDGSSTEIFGEGLSEGMEVVVGEERESTTQEVNNPFGPPKIPRNTKKAN